MLEPLSPLMVGTL